MATLRISSRLLIVGVNPYVLLSAEDVMRLKKRWRRPMPVKFQINNSKRSWRVNLMPVGNGSFRLYLNGEIREACHLKVGCALNISAQFDEKYRNGPLQRMPLWFSGPLAKNPRSQLGWNHLSPSRKKEILRYFARLKSEEAKERNLNRALHVLAGEQGRFMGREWKQENPL